MKYVEFSSDSIVKRLWIEFETYNGENFGLGNKICPVIRSEISYEYDFKRIRCRFLLNLVYATTAHKSQGSTLKQVCVSILEKKSLVLELLMLR